MKEAGLILVGNAILRQQRRTSSGSPESLKGVKNDVGDDIKNNTNKMRKTTSEVKEEPKDKNFFDVPPVVKVEHGQVPRYPERDKATTDVKEGPEDENFFDVPPVKVEHG